MVYPDSQTARIYADTYTQTPVHIALDYEVDDTLDLYVALRGPYSFFLESGVLNSCGRYSVIALPCRKRLINKGGTTTFIQYDEAIQLSGDPLDILRKEMQECAPTYPELPVFIGGTIGHFNYDVTYLFEATQDTRLPSLKPPLIQSAFVEELLIFGHEQHRPYVIVNMQTQSGCPDNAHDKAVQRIYELQTSLSHRRLYSGKPLAGRTVTSSMNKQ